MGIKRLAPNEIPGVGLATIRKVNRATRRGKRKLLTLTPADLCQHNRQQQHDYTASLAMLDLLGTESHSSHVAARRKVANSDPVFRPDFEMFKNT